MVSVDEQIVQLDLLAGPALRQRWAALTGAPVPRVSPAMLRLALAWEIQARASGGLSRSAQQRLAQLGNARTVTTQPRAGMRLVREWNGKAHVVTIGEDQVIRWQDREWRSLSEVARAITGTRWSGPAFFGLKKRVAA